MGSERGKEARREPLRELHLFFFTGKGYSSHVFFLLFCGVIIAIQGPVMA